MRDRENERREERRKRKRERKREKKERGRDIMKKPINCFFVRLTLIGHSRESPTKNFIHTHTHTPKFL